MMHTPEMREVMSKFFEGMKLHPELQLEKIKSSKDLEGFEEYWGPLNKSKVDATLEAAKTNDKVVITYADGLSITREYVMHKLKEDGATNITMLYLTLDEDKKLEELYHRQKRQFEAMGFSLEDWAKTKGWDGSEGEELPMEEFKKIAIQPGEVGNMGPFEDPPPYAKIVDVTERDATTMDKIDETLGLHRSGEESYEEIVKKVRERDFKRDEEMPYRWDLWPEIEKEVEEALAEAKTEEEKKQIKRRASSLISLEMKTPSGRASIMSNLSRASSVESLSYSTKLRNKSRSSLIRTGRVE